MYDNLMHNPEWSNIKVIDYSAITLYAIQGNRQKSVIRNKRKKKVDISEFNVLVFPIPDSMTLTSSQYENGII